MRTPKLALFPGLVLIFAMGCGSNGNSARVNSKKTTQKTNKETEQKSNQTPTRKTETEPSETEPKEAEPEEVIELREELPQQEAVPANRAATPDPRAALYKPKTWPEASLGRDGVAFLTITAPGWTRAFFQVDPRRGQATLGFKSTLAKGVTEDQAGEGAAVFLTVRVHSNAAAARQSLLKSLLTVTSALKREESLGDVAFTSRKGQSLQYAAAVRGNVTFITRSAEAGIDASVVANATDAAIQKSPAVNKSGALSKPAITGFGVELAKTGQANSLTLDFDAQSPSPSYIAFQCAPRASVSVVKNGETYELYAGNPGTVSVKAFACSDRLQTSVFETEIEVVKGE